MMLRGLFRCLLVAIVVFTTATALADSAGEQDDGSVAVDEPVFPGPDGRDTVRVWLETFYAPAADVGDAEVSLVRPELRLRARLPIQTRASLQLTVSFGTSHYDVDDAGALFEDCVTCPVPDDLYAAFLGLQGGFLLNPTGHLLRPGEQWGLLAAAFGRARWEAGAFDDSLTGGGSLGLGYKLPGRLRIALGARVESSIEDGDISVGPMVDLRWAITDRLRLRSRGLGAQLEFRPSQRLELFATAFRSSDRFRLDSPAGAASDMTFSDRHFLVGAGVEWRVWEHLHIATEAGAIVSRRLSVASEDEGNLDSTNGDLSPYMEIRLEIRP